MLTYAFVLVPPSRWLGPSILEARHVSMADLTVSLTAAEPYQYVPFSLVAAFGMYKEGPGLLHRTAEARVGFPLLCI